MSRPVFASHARAPADIETLQLSHFSGTDLIGAGASLPSLLLRTSEAPIIPETLGQWRPETPGTPGTHTFIIITKPPSQLNTIYGMMVTHKVSSIIPILRSTSITCHSMYPRKEKHHLHREQSTRVHPTSCLRPEGGGS